MDMFQTYVEEVLEEDDVALVDEPPSLLVVDETSPVEDAAVDVENKLLPPSPPSVVDADVDVGVPSLLGFGTGGSPVLLLELSLLGFGTGGSPVLLLEPSLVGFGTGGSPVLLLGSGTGGSSVLLPESSLLGFGLGGTGGLLVGPPLSLPAGVVGGRLLCPLPVGWRLPLVMDGPEPRLVGGLMGPRIMM